MRTKCFRAPWNYQMNLLFRCDFCFVCFVFISDESVTSILDKNTGKAFIHMTEIYCLVTISYEVFKRLQAFLFFPFVGYQSGNRKKTHFALLGSRSEHRFPPRSLVPPKHINSREIGKTCQQKWKIRHQNHDDYDFLITYINETSSTTRSIILFF